MVNRKKIFAIFMFSQLFGLAQMTSANNINVTNAVFSPGGAGYVNIQADVSWDNSWRAEWEEPVGTINTNWDAAWIFVKYRYQGGDWQHAWLSANSGDYVVPAGATISVGTSTNSGGTNFGCGVFLYRSAEGSGNWTNTIKLRWNYAENGLPSTARVDVSVYAIEMVYVPQGSFYVGSGGTESGSFTEGNAATTWTNGVTPSVPFTITNEASLTISNAAGCLWGTSTNVSASDTIGGVGTLPDEYPKGYNAFYCMKYEISQGQYTGFLNMLTSAQAATRYSNTNGNKRHTISGTYPNFTNTSPDRACNYLSWADGAAYADWAGLRPMTELEFEKACRGPLAPVANEYAWGTSAIIDDDGDGTIDVTSPEDGSEVWTNSAVAQLGVGDRGAAVFGYNQIKVGGVTNDVGPVRCGLFATASSTRITSGSTYWGIMEMSGNLWERPVTVANAGRTFTGAVGNGVLNSSGNADTALWPGSAGFRGGSWDVSGGISRASDRYRANLGMIDRGSGYGFRAVRVVLSGE